MNIDFSGFYGALGEDFVEKYIVPFQDKETKLYELEDLGGYYHLTNKKEGIEFVFNLDYQLDTIIFYTDGYKCFNAFSSSNLPLGISFEFGQKEIHNKFGTPTKSKVTPIVALNIPAYDIYSYGNYQFSVFYAEDFKSIVSMQIVVPAIIPAVTIGD